jgi:predicted nucleotidyltransferase component of viral defense system
MGTKLRALYQRKKGRDLYDFWYAHKQIYHLDTTSIMNIFNHYMHKENTQISRAEFERNLTLKQKSKIFDNDIQALLSFEQKKQYDLSEAYEIVFNEFLSKLAGEPWKGMS